MKLSTNKYTKEVEEILINASLNCDRVKAEKLKKYIGTQLHVHGLKSPHQTEIYKKGFQFYTDNSIETFNILSQVYHTSPSFEGKILVFIFLDKKHLLIPKKEQLKILPKYVKAVDNWAISDSLSKFLNKLVLDKETQKEMLTILKEWNTSINPWERRQSLISLFYYSRTSSHHVSFTLTKKLVMNLISDSDYYVQKAVGWTLREAYNVYPKDTYNLIEEHCDKITSIAFTTCIEKMTDKEKILLKLKRKNTRKK